MMTNGATALRPVLRLGSITKSFSGVTALHDVSIEVAPGEVLALLGENGAGKSTLMNIASGALAPDSGALSVSGVEHASLTPAAARHLGIAIVHQHPALLPDLTVLENLLVAVPRDAFTDDIRAASSLMLATVGLDAGLDVRVSDLSIAQKHLLEIAKALAIRPNVLILDEPTAPLDADLSERLFELIRETAARGTGVVYITHRLAEVRKISDRVTVLRDGRVRADMPVDEVTDEELLEAIIGHQLEAAFPEKAVDDERIDLVVEGLSGRSFHDVSVTARRGQIVGLAGIVGNGQSSVLQALAGLEDWSGTVRIGSLVAGESDRIRDVAYLPADRHVEGLLMTLPVRENTAVAALARFRGSLGLLSRRAELSDVRESLGSLSVKATSLDASVSTLSGGNQQKVMLARAMLSRPSMLLADEPTQGVDVGARAEIYSLLRGISGSGIPVVVASSDAMELEGLCDVVLVMSEGRVVKVLEGDEITQEAMIRATVSSTERRTERVAPVPSGGALRAFVNSQYSPTLLLCGVVLVFGAMIFSQNMRYVSAFNISSILTLTAALGFIALGQTFALLIGGIDLAVGPLAGLIVIVGSFFLSHDSAVVSLVLGLVMMIGVAVVTGATNGALIHFGRFTPIAATLTLYIALQGVSYLLRPTPGGYIASSSVAVITAKLGPVPVAFIVLVGATFALEWGLRRSRWGRSLRAVGSDLASARKLGVHVALVRIGAYLASSVLTFFGAVLLMAQIGLGDAAQGVEYTLMSITAVVLGGTSLLGGRGTFVGSLVGALLLIQIVNSAVFLGFDQMWQYVLQGGLVLAAAVFYSLLRRRDRASA